MHTWVAGLIAVVAGATPAADKPKVVVMPLQSSALDESAVATLDELLTEAVRRLGQHEVLGKTDIDAMLGLENLRDQLGCDDVTCAAEIGGALGAGFLLAGRASKLGDNIIIVLKLINASEQRVENSVKHKATNDENLYDQAIQDTVLLLFGLQEAPVPAASAGNVLIKTEPPGAMVSIDGKPIGQAPVGRDLRVGDHTVEAILDGYLTKERTVAVASGSMEEILLVLEAPPAHSFSTWGHVALWSGVGVTLFGGVASIMTMSEWDSYREAGDESHKEASDLWHNLMITGFTVGGALMATGIVLWVLEPSPDDWARQWQEGVSFMAIPSRQGVVLGLSGSWQ